MVILDFKDRKVNKDLKEIREILVVKGLSDQKDRKVIEVNKVYLENEVLKER
jgi:hypothetical protein